MSVVDPPVDSVRARLDPAVWRLHLGPRPYRAQGRFNVRHGSSPLARMIARLSGLPRQGRDIPVVLEIASGDRYDVWVRRFNGQRLRTVERRGVWPPVERYGLLELSYEAEAGDGLTMRSIRARLRLGPFAVAIPRRLAPRDVATVTSRGERAVHVSVRAELPLFGLLIAYEGVIEEVT